MVHLLHELLRIQTDIAAARRHYDYMMRQVGENPHDGAMQTPAYLDAAGRAIEHCVQQTGVWLKAQVIGLYDPGLAYDAQRSITPQRWADDVD